MKERGVEQEAKKYLRKQNLEVLERSHSSEWLEQR